MILLMKFDEFKLIKEGSTITLIIFLFPFILTFLYFAINKRYSKIEEKYINMNEDDLEKMKKYMLLFYLIPANIFIVTMIIYCMTFNFAK